MGNSVLVLNFVALVRPGRSGARQRTWGWATTAFTPFFLSLGPLAWRHWLVADPIHEGDDLVVYDTSRSLWRTGFGDRPELSLGLQAVQSSADHDAGLPG